MDYGEYPERFIIRGTDFPNKSFKRGMVFYFDEVRLVLDETIVCYKGKNGNNLNCQVDRFLEKINDRVLIPF